MSPDTSASTGPADLLLRMTFLSLEDGELLIHEPDGVSTLEVTLKAPGTEELLIPSFETPVGPDSSGPIEAALPGVSTGVPFVLTVVGRDGGGNALYDYQRRHEVKSGDPEVIEIGLTRIDQVVSGRLMVQPMTRVGPNLARFLDENLREELDRLGIKLFLQDGTEGLVYPRSPGGRWKINNGETTVVADRDGRFRLPVPAVGSSATVVHASDSTFRCAFDPAGLSPGQRVGEDLLVAMGFSLGCGMTDPDEFCSPIPDIPPPSEEASNPRLVLTPIDKAGADLTTNDCGIQVPLPVEIQILPRGTYPKPTRLSQLSTREPVERDCHAECEDGRADSLHAGHLPTGFGASYLGTVCEKFVLAGCCPNENPSADRQYSLFYNTLGRISAGRAQLVDPPDARDRFTCQDNHKARVCQQILIGDVSLDFHEGEAGVVRPSSATPTIEVRPGENVDFVLHNNGCFGVTNVVRPLRLPAINGVLKRTYREIPSTLSGVLPGGGRRFTSTDPLLEGAPNFGLLDAGDPQPSVLVEEDFSSDDVGGDPFPKVKAIEHFFSDGTTNADNPCEHYRYFPDVALRYEVPATARAGQRDAFRFDVDGCAVSVEFVVRGSIVEPTPTVTPSISPPPPPPEGPPSYELRNADGVTGVFLEGVSSCPLFLSNVPTIENTGTETLEFTITTADPLTPVSIVPNFGELPAGQTLFPTVRYDCRVKAGFSTELIITITRPANGAQVVETVPLEMEYRSGPVTDPDDHITLLPDSLSISYDPDGVCPQPIGEFRVRNNLDRRIQVGIPNPGGHIDVLSRPLASFLLEAGETSDPFTVVYECNSSRDVDEFVSVTTSFDGRFGEEDRLSVFVDLP